MLYYKNDCHSPMYNLAMEEYLFRKNIDENVLLLWINEPTIVIGKNQNTWNEINIDFVQENDVHVVRRITGGGAVYHDLGNLNFSFISPDDNMAIDFKEINEPIIHALRNMGVPCEFTGRNDLAIKGAKFSGIAQYKTKGRVLNHGTLLFDSDLDVLSNALQVREEKYLSKGVKSVRSRVTNIKPWLDEVIDTEKFRDKLLESIELYQQEEVKQVELTEKEEQEIRELMESKYMTKAWNYGKSPAFSHVSHQKFPTGTLDLGFIVKDDHIEEMKIFGDFFGTKDVKHLEELFINRPWPIEDLDFIPTDLDLTPYLGRITREELLELVQRAGR